MNYKEDINLIKELLASGNIDLARESIDNIYAKNPNDFFLENFYGAFLALDPDKNSQESAIIKFKRSIELNNKFSEPYYNLARIYFNRENYYECADLLKFSIVLEPDNIHYKNLLGHTYIKLKKYIEAAELFNLIIKYEFDNANAYFGLGLVYYQTEEFHKAIFFFKKAIDLKINRVEAYIELSKCYNKTRNNYCENLKLTSEAVKLFRSPLLFILHAKNLFRFMQIEDGFFYFQESIKLDSDILDYYHNYLFYFNYKPNLNFNNYLELAKKFETKYLEINKFKKYDTNLKMQKKIKLGFVSYDFRDHVIMYQIFDVLKELHKNSEFILYGYYNNAVDDNVTKEVKKYFHFWLNISEMSDSESTNRIRNDEINILFDLSGYTAGNKIGIFIQRAAAIQISWAGYLNSAGLKNMDYIIADSNVVPVNSKNIFMERIIRLPNAWTTLSELGMPVTTQVSNITPAIFNKYLTFGCFSKIYKINNEVIDLIIKILKNITNSRFIFQSEYFEDLDYKNYFINIFTTNGIEKERLVLLGDLKRNEFLLKYNEVDIIFDTFPYGGGTTSLEASWMCVPIITKEGDTFLSRCGLSINFNLGLSEMVYKNEDECINKIKSFNNDYNKIQLIKERLIKNKNLHPLFNSKMFANDLSKQIHQVIKENKEKFDFH
jgi:predicted O-linked N-acetylglucosamine transferase (SPINDLY family)